ncbi:MAG: mannose-1-phosphate guanylyltransferase [Rhodothermales bacterium]
MTEANVYCLVMAGGVGRRFWPMSRVERPKQFLRFFGDRSLLQMTVDRIRPIIPPSQCLIVTNERYLEQTVTQLPEVPRENILLEPVSRNTAPCIAFGAGMVHRVRGDAVMVVLPADHLIQDEASFHKVLNAAIEKARTPGVLVTVGIRPNRAATGYGYIEFDVEDREGTGVHRVLSFTEKPDPARAEEFLEAGRYLWNSGMFAWRADTILREVEQSLPAVYSAFAPLLSGDAPDRRKVTEAFLQSPSISVDYGVMEKARDVFVVPGQFGWSDVGDWQAAYEVAPKDAAENASFGDVQFHDSSGCLAYASDRKISLLGARDLVVVDAGDAILVCDRKQAQRVKEAANRTEQGNGQNGRDSNAP